MKVLVTGSNGFVGRHLVRTLAERGVAVVAADLRGFDRQLLPPSARELVEVVSADLRDSDAMSAACRGCDAIYHVASLVQTRTTGADEVFDVNVGGSRVLMSAARGAGVPRLIYVSSASVVYEGHDIERGDETLPYPARFHAPYAAAKARAEQEILAASDGALATCAVRPHIVFGPGDTRFFPAVLSRARAGKLRAYVGDPNKLSDFTYIDNLVEGLIQAGEHLTSTSALAGQAYFVTNGEPMAFWEMVGRLLDGLDLTRPSYRVPFAIAFSSAAIREGLDALRGIQTTEESLTRFTIRYLTTHHYFSCAKAKRDFGYQPIVPLEEGIARTIQALRAS